MVSFSPFLQSCDPTLNPGAIRCLRMWACLSDPGHPLHPKHSPNCSQAGLPLQGISDGFQKVQMGVRVGLWHLKITGPFRVTQGAGSSCHLHLGQGALCEIATPSLPTERESHMGVPGRKLCLQRWIDQNMEKLDCCKSRTKLSWGIFSLSLIAIYFPRSILSTV